ncbi:hypothetical protein [Tabrizicola sp.]|uniref:hypothetical protein n=1 Tax=Tabrizicola sp. TaxID=2005166 RepID=UPI00286AAA32|nr:hypothetical protein [Tabrizicola sp.]
MIYLWASTGHHSGTGRPLRIVGWEDWDLGPDHLVQTSRGWFDAVDYARQVAGG